MTHPENPHCVAEPAVYKTLLESTKAIPWQIDWATMRFSYIGPQIEALLGWPQDSWKSADDWAARIHEDDRAAVVAYCVAQSKAGLDHEADYRALTRDSGFVWIRDVVHVVRNAAGEVSSLVGFMFDISERKATEDKLIRLQQELEALSFHDQLTGLANRRLLDARIDTEWRSASRTGEPLSLLMLDIDYFKQYNDRYGHLQGDRCLQQVAHALKLAVTRPRDVIARFGGEEFTVLLPETDAAAALRVAQICQRKIARLALPHAASPGPRQVAVSVGVGTIHPAAGVAPSVFIEQVDKQLYRAKQQGRNRIEQARAETTPDALKLATRTATLAARDAA